MRSLFLVLGCLAMLLVGLPDAAVAGAKSVARSSVRSQVRYGMGHHVALPAGVYEGVSVSTSRSHSKNSTCYANSGMQRVASKTRCVGGKCYTSNIFKP